MNLLTNTAKTAPQTFSSSTCPDGSKAIDFYTVSASSTHRPKASRDSFAMEQRAVKIIKSLYYIFDEKFSDDIGEGLDIEEGIDIRDGNTKDVFLDMTISEDVVSGKHSENDEDSDSFVNDTMNAYPTIKKMGEGSGAIEPSKYKSSDRAKGNIDETKDCTNKKNKGCLPVCYVCQITFSSRSILNRHMREQHLGNEKYACIDCDKVFSRKHSLNKHWGRKHEKNKNYNCNFCDQFYVNSLSLNRHMYEIHEEDAIHRCTDCKEAFVKRFKLNIHKNEIHEKNIRIKCTDCNKRFSCKSSMQDHRNIVHRGIAYKCPDCHKIYSRERNMKDHWQIKHGENIKHGCPDCGKTFSRKRNMKAHRNVAHGKK